MDKHCDPVRLAQSPKSLNPGNTKNTKNYKVPHPGLAPENSEKNNEKYENGNFWANFVWFRHFFRIFGGQPGVGGFVIFFVLFRISRIQAFLARSVPALQDRKTINHTELEPEGPKRGCQSGGEVGAMGTSYLVSDSGIRFVCLFPSMPRCPPPYMREIGTMWQIGVLTGKPCTFLVQNGSFSAFLHYKNRDRVSRGLDVKWRIPSACLDASKKRFSTRIHSIDRVSKWLWQANQETPQNGQNVHGFHVRTPICHIVHVSRAYPYTPKHLCESKSEKLQNCSCTKYIILKAANAH